MTDLLNSIHYELPTLLKESVVVSDLVHMVQLQDIFEKKFNHITFIGKYSEILKDQSDLIYKMNNSIKVNICSLFLNNQVDNNLFRPNHTTNLYKYEICDDFKQLYNGMIKCNDFYILINTENEDLKYNVYATTEAQSDHLNVKYCCLMFIGKIINPTPYKNDEVELFEKLNNFQLSVKCKEYLLNNPKIYHSNITNKIYFINLFGNFPDLGKKFDRLEDKYDLEHYRSLLNEIYEKQLLDEKYDHTKDNVYNDICDNMANEYKNFYNGFIKLGTIINNSEKNIIVDIFILLNAEETLQGSIWINENLPDIDNKTEDFINYLPVKKMVKVGKLF